METDFPNLLSTTWGEHCESSSSKSSGSNQKRVKLFGFELNPVQKIDQACLKSSLEGDHESVNSSTSPDRSWEREENISKKNKSSKSKFECQYCHKEFANSQALGGHQNAHKKERMKKKQLQIQARKTNSIKYYLQQPFLQNSHNFNTTPWFYDDDFANNYESRQISFSLSHLPTQSPLSVMSSRMKDNCVFTLTHDDRCSGEALDLQLGLDL